MKQKTELKFTDLMDRYLLSKEAEGKSPATISGYRDILNAGNRYLGEHGGTISSINREWADRYLLYLRKRPRFTGRRVTAGTNPGLAEESIRDHLRALKVFFSWLFEEGYVKENAFQRIKLKKAHNQVKKPLGDSEIMTVLKAIDPHTPTGQRNKGIVELAFDGGFRAGEIAGAKLNDLDQINGTLKVLGKGNKERVVPLGRRVHTDLLHYINFIRPNPTPGIDALFLTQEGKPISVNTIKLIFSRLARKSGVTRLHAHLCRHTFAINYLMNGGDVLSLKEILGHESLEMVNRYVHFNTAQIAARHREFSPMDRLFDNHRK